jgi:hypothetical protein
MLVDEKRCLQRRASPKWYTRTNSLFLLAVRSLGEDSSGCVVVEVSNPRRRSRSGCRHGRDRIRGRKPHKR